MCQLTIWQRALSIWRSRATRVFQMSRGLKLCCLLFWKVKRRSCLQACRSKGQGAQRKWLYQQAYGQQTRRRRTPTRLLQAEDHNSPYTHIYKHYSNPNQATSQKQVAPKASPSPQEAFLNHRRTLFCST